jgi:hypothetical protein
LDAGETPVGSGGELQGKTFSHFINHSFIFKFVFHVHGTWRYTKISLEHFERRGDLDLETSTIDRTK